MQQRTLGRQGLVTSAIGYGAMGISLAYGPGDDAEGAAAIRRALEEVTLRQLAGLDSATLRVADLAAEIHVNKIHVDT